MVRSGALFPAAFRGAGGSFAENVSGSESGRIGLLRCCACTLHHLVDGHWSIGRHPVGRHHGPDFR